MLTFIEQVHKNRRLLWCFNGTFVNLEHFHYINKEQPRKFNPLWTFTHLTLFSKALLVHSTLKQYSVFCQYVFKIITWFMMQFWYRIRILITDLLHSCLLYSLYCRRRCPWCRSRDPCSAHRCIGCSERHILSPSSHCNKDSAPWSTGRCHCTTPDRQL